MDIEFKFTPVLKSAVDRVIIHSQTLGIDKEQLALLESFIKHSKPGIPYALIKQISTYLKQIYNTTTNNTTENEKKQDNNNNPPCYLQDLLKGSTVYIQPKPIVQESAEITAKRIYLQNKLENQRYDKMTKNVGVKQEEDPMELGDFRSQLSIGVNILVTFFTLLACGLFVGGKYWDSYLIGLAFGLGCGIAGVAVETWLYVIKSTESQMKKTKDDKLDARKKFIEIRKITREIKKSNEKPLLTAAADSPLDEHAIAFS
ncbi:hypothetical protein DFA_08559 [Cavenderia fasciculata]|uniref:Uncharacterized protein n=1 Tax=Cavenderia fasciculata TaxID=261658 RepID=F4Q2Z9_CACFS|nr:uncharacterized protein DFA_08559 [Cavenderia fasciculata]EGG17563.1 hypothetical protein DFA_08559 [Cavenderia fasciculata]|eukprot:XP_004356047.1 hypothetical protein DFA_08559 [Cavenderia fasciculata]